MDCDLNAISSDTDCHEYWDIPCPYPEFNCFKTVVEDSCILGDLNCYVGFLRGICAQYDVLTVCDEPEFRSTLKKYNSCLPGEPDC